MRELEKSQSSGNYRPFVYTSDVAVNEPKPATVRNDMNLHYRIFITAKRLCQLLVILLPVTYGMPPLQAQTAAPATGVAPSVFGNAEGEPITLKARQQEYVKGVVTLSGDVEADVLGYTLRAEQASYDKDSGIITASGGVVLDGGTHDLHMTASHAVFNTKTGHATFYDVAGSLGTRLRGQSVVLTSAAPFLFTGKTVEKLDGDHYIVHHGTVTSCQMAKPMWNFDAGTVDVQAGDEAVLRHATFRLHTIPVFYFPYASHPVDSTSRHSGFTLPTIGDSTSKGLTLGESYYWAINRSMDATISGEYFSKRGWSQRGEFRSRPGQNSKLEVHYFGVLDRGTNVTENGVTTKQDQSGEEITLNGETRLPYDIRGVANIDYLSSFLFRAAFSESYTQAIDSEAKSSAFLSKTTNGYSLGFAVERYQNFQLDLLTSSGYESNSSMKAGNQILAVHAPTLDFSTVERPMSAGPLLWHLDASAGGLSRREPDFVSDNLYGRYDVRPELILPLHLGEWTLRSAVALRDTFYTQQKLADTATTTGSPIDRSINRRAIEADFALNPPALERVFAKEIFGRRIKHVIEPRLEYHYTGGVDRFPAFIRLDEHDILSDTNQLEVGFTQRLFAKRLHPRLDPLCETMAETAPALLAQNSPVKPGEFLPGSTAEPLHCEAEAPVAREIFTWEIKQRYYFNPDFGGALVDGDRNVLSASADYAGIAFLLGPRRWAPLVSRMNYSPVANTEFSWELDYDSVRDRINSSTAAVNYRISEIFFGASHAFFHDSGVVQTTVNPPDVFNQFHLLAGYGHPGKPGLSAGASLGFDEYRLFRQYTAAQASYNWDCCGLSFEYRDFSLGTVRANEHQYRFTFSLLNVGTFGNLRKKERLY
jgi:LPS-assembly protein